jgi:hypothetical protein
MLRIEAPKEMTWQGYGVTLVPGVNTLDQEIPHGLMRSFERHHEAGLIKILRDEPPVTSPQGRAAAAPQRRKVR